MVAMGLPPETFREYADRIFERFPRLFLALGCPTLQAEFDLQAKDGAKVVVAETPACMLVELRLPRRTAGAVAAVGLEGAAAVPAGFAGVHTGARGGRGLTCEVESQSDHDDLESPSGKASALTERASSESLSPFSSSRKLVKAFARTVSGALRERATGTDATVAPARCSRAALRSRRPSKDLGVGGQPPGCAPATVAADTAALQLSATPYKELPILLSAAALARLPARKPSKDWTCVDPGKPMLSSPGSHNPWSPREENEPVARVGASSSTVTHQSGCPRPKSVQ
mmetsp:Transcript_149103/g.415572  ORF Transcript_149103/g.415572 Transcript_149103/m.415572 type:complete len:286 (+) Transcript_149103:81-938(+)